MDRYDYRGDLHLRQWGRGQTAAESPGQHAGGQVDNLRQWGRGQTAAESSWTFCAKNMVPRVNGAAARRPRKAIEGDRKPRER